MGATCCARAAGRGLRPGGRDLRAAAPEINEPARAARRAPAPMQVNRERVNYFETSAELAPNSGVGRRFARQYNALWCALLTLSQRRAGRQ